MGKHSLQAKHKDILHLENIRILWTYQEHTYELGVNTSCERTLWTKCEQVWLMNMNIPYVNTPYERHANTSLNLTRTHLMNQMWTHHLWTYGCKQSYTISAWHVLPLEHKPALQTAYEHTANIRPNWIHVVNVQFLNYWNAFSSVTIKLWWIQQISLVLFLFGCVSLWAPRRGYPCGVVWLGQWYHNPAGICHHPDVHHHVSIREICHLVLHCNMIRSVL